MYAVSLASAMAPQYHGRGKKINEKIKADHDLIDFDKSVAKEEGQCRKD